MEFLMKRFYLTAIALTVALQASTFDKAPGVSVPQPLSGAALLKTEALAPRALSPQDDGLGWAWAASGADFHSPWLSLNTNPGQDRSVAFNYPWLRDIERLSGIDLGETGRLHLYLKHRHHHPDDVQKAAIAAQLQCARRFFTEVVLSDADRLHLATLYYERFLSEKLTNSLISWWRKQSPEERKTLPVSFWIGVFDNASVAQSLDKSLPVSFNAQKKKSHRAFPGFEMAVLGIFALAQALAVSQGNLEASWGWAGFYPLAIRFVEWWAQLGTPTVWKAMKKSGERYRIVANEDWLDVVKIYVPAPLAQRPIVKAKFLVHEPMLHALHVVPRIEWEGKGWVVTLIHPRGAISSSDQLMMGLAVNGTIEHATIGARVDFRNTRTPPGRLARIAA